jgi:DNA-binding transcriptional MocR family regulator
VLTAIFERMEAPTKLGLANAVAAAIREGALKDGDRLPPIRDVAREFSLSPATVSAAWTLLRSSGAIRTDGRRGTVVAPSSAGPNRYRRAIPSPDRLKLTIDLSAGLPDPRLIPPIGPALTAVADRVPQHGYLDDSLLPELGEVITTDLPFEPERLTVVDGAMDALQLVSTQTLRFGDLVLVENPTFPPLIDLLESIGVRVLGLPLDGEGLLADEVAAHAGRAAAIVLQPRAHNPVGVSMSAARARALARVVAAHPKLLVVEDDSSGPVSATRPVSLGSHVPAQTVHIRSYSKSHGPDLRIAALAGPAAIVDPLIDRRRLGQGWTSRLLQAALHHQLTHDEPVAAVARARREYATRRQRLADELRRLGITVAGDDGLNLWLPVDNELAALLALATAGIGAAAGAPFGTDGQHAPHLRITTATLDGGHRDVAQALAEAASVGVQAPPR